MGNFRSLQHQRHAAFTSPTPSRSLLLPPPRSFAPPSHASSPFSGDLAAELEHAKRFGHSLDRIAIHRSDKENTTGLPDNLKAGIENLSGLFLDDVQVHYHSSKPAEVQALAYTQGTQIHIGLGQEKHLAHEAWHVVQQKQGRVEPTWQAKGLAINDDQRLEREADVMGKQAIAGQSAQEKIRDNSSTSLNNRQGVIQRVIQWGQWQTHLWKEQGLNLPFTPAEKLEENEHEAKWQMLQILEEAARVKEDIREAVNAPGSSHDEYLIEKLSPFTIMRGLFPDLTVEENRLNLDYRKSVEESKKEHNTYLYVTGGIHKSVNERKPHMTVQTWQGGKRVKTYHLIVQFHQDTGQWKLEEIKVG